MPAEGHQTKVLWANASYRIPNNDPVGICQLKDTKQLSRELMPAEGNQTVIMWANDSWRTPISDPVSQC